MSTIANILILYLLDCSFLFIDLLIIHTTQISSSLLSLTFVVYCSDSFHQGTQITKGNTWIKTLNIVFESLRFGISVLCVKNATNNETKTKNALIKNAKVLSFSISWTTKFQPPFQLSIGLRRQRRWWGRWGMGVGLGLGLWLGLRLGVMRRSNFSTRRFKLSSVRAEFFWLVSFFLGLCCSLLLFGSYCSCKQRLAVDFSSASRLSGSTTTPWQGNSNSESPARLQVKLKRNHSSFAVRRPSKLVWQSFVAALRSHRNLAGIGLACCLSSSSTSTSSSSAGNFQRNAENVATAGLAQAEWLYRYFN